MPLTMLAFPILIFLAGCLVTYIVVKFILYIFQSIGLLNIAKKEEYKNKFMVWIPGISHYILGKYCMKERNAIIYSILSILKVIAIICAFSTKNRILFYISLIYTAIYFIIDMVAMNTFYKKVYKHYQIYTILTIITLGLLKPIFIYTTKIHKITNYDI